LEVQDESGIAILDRAPALLLAHVVPSVFNVWHCAFIDGSHVGIHHRAIKLSVQFLVFQSFGLNSAHYSLLECFCLLHEFNAQFFHIHLIQVLELCFINQRSNHSEAVSIFEEGCEKTPDAIFLLDIIRKTILRG
jgi:hypothetical protein